MPDAGDLRDTKIGVIEAPSSEAPPSRPDAALQLMSSLRPPVRPQSRKRVRLGRRRRRVMIVGAGDDGRAVIAELQRLSDQFEILGIFDDRKTRLPPTLLGLPILGTVADLVVAARADLPDEIIVTISQASFERLSAVFAPLVLLPVDLRFTMHALPPAFRLSNSSYVGAIPLLDISHKPIRGFNAVVKQAEDWVGAAIALLLLSPVMLLVALLIKLDSRGPVLFRQPRYGFNNQVIQILKFRSMQVATGDITGAQRTVRGDARVTRVGAILRKFSIDELPQLFNVLRGEMSLVGPRAHAVAMRVDGTLYHESIVEYSGRHRVRPGITGYAQINGSRGEVATKEAAQRRLDLDLDYIFRWSLWLDIKIVLKTVRLVLFDRSDTF